VPRAGLNAEVVVTEALGLVDEVGHDGLTLAALAARCGVATPSLYKHVDGLDDLRRRLAVRAVHELGEALARGADEHHPHGPLPPVAHAYRGYARQWPGRYAATLRAPAPDDADHLAASRSVLETVFGVLDAYGLPHEARIDASRAVRAGLHGFVALEAAGGFGLPRDVDRSFDHLVAALVRVLNDWS